jgi:subtilase family serine protease
MRNHSLAIGVALCALTTLGLSLPSHAATAKHVETLGAADQGAITHFNVYLPLTHQDVLEQFLREQTDSTSLNYHRWLTPAQFKAQFGPSSSDVAHVKAELEAAGFTVVSERTQSLEVEGPVRAVEAMFATHLQKVRTEKGRCEICGRRGPPDTA